MIKTIQTIFYRLGVHRDIIDITENNNNFFFKNKFLHNLETQVDSTSLPQLEFSAFKQAQKQILMASFLL